jgi:hypothetical protein
MISLIVFYIIVWALAFYGAYCLFRELAPFSANVKWFGAVGDGVADDTNAMQRAIDILPSHSVLYFPSGQYKTTEAINLNKSMSLMGVNNN